MIDLSKVALPYPWIISEEKWVSREEWKNLLADREGNLRHSLRWFSDGTVGFCIQEGGTFVRIRCEEEP